MLVYLYEHYWRPDAFPEIGQLTRKLGAAGFEQQEITEALAWVGGLKQAMSNGPDGPSLGRVSSMRVFAQAELDSLDDDALACLRFLEQSAMLPPILREMVLDRVVALPIQPVSLDDLRVIILMVFWSVGEEPGALVMDELHASVGPRVWH